MKIEHSPSRVFAVRFNCVVLEHTCYKKPTQVAQQCGCAALLKCTLKNGQDDALSAHVFCYN